MFCRWLFEWLTQVVGWTAHDTSVSKWTDVISDGSGATQGLTTADSAKVDMSSSGRSWTAADKGRYLTINGLSDSTLNGIYLIAGVEAGDIVVLDILHGVHEDGLIDGDSFDWRLWEARSSYYPSSLDWAVVRSSYSHTPAEPNFDIRFVCNGNSRDGLPTVGIGPFGTWNNTSHAWSDDRNTAQKNANPDAGYIHSLQVFAYADDNHAVISMWTREWTVSGSYKFPCFMYLGEATVPSVVDDTNPGVIANGGMDDAPIGWIEGNVIGSPAYDNVYNSVAWMSKLPANNTEVQGYLQIPDIRVAGSVNMLQQPFPYSHARRLPRIEIGLDCRTAGHMEYRGRLKRVWASLCTLPFNTAFGSSKEYLHLFGGLSIPWNGSHSHVFIL